MTYNIDTEYFETKAIDDIAVIRLKNNVYKLVTHLDESEKMMNFIRQTEYDEKIHVLLVINDNKIFGEEMYDSFINGIIEQQSLKRKEAPSFAEKTLRFREINILNKIVMVLAEYQKLLYFGMVGDVVTPFLGTSLAADFRFASDQTQFIFSHNKFGLHPTAALPYFLSKQLGHSKAMEIVLGDKLSCEKAFDLGLVNKLLPIENFENACIDHIKAQFNCKSCTVRRTKQLINFSRRDLKDYFHYEASLLNL
ncbi:enoyl-CoA hydratase-related protein [Bacteroidota bacterium]